jgi:hypothetical protein
VAQEQLVERSPVTGGDVREELAVARRLLVDCHALLVPSNGPIGSRLATFSSIARGCLTVGARLT